MADRCAATRNSIGNQAELFRLAERDYGLSIKLLAAKTDIPVATLRDWRDGTVMPAWALFKLAHEGGVPDYLVSFIAEPFRRAVVMDEQESDLDLIAADAAEFSHEYAKARNAHGPGGIAIVPQEAAVLMDIAKRMAGRARAL